MYAGCETSAKGKGSMEGQHIKASLVGMRFYESSASDAARAIKESAILVREPRNRHDPNAVAVFSKEKKLGHIDRKSAARVARIMDASGTCTICLDDTKCATASMVPVIIGLQHAAGSPTKDACAPVPPICKGVVAGIYEIRVLSERRSYFGQSLDAQSRIQTHWRDLYSGCHANPELQIHWDDYGPSGLRVRLIARAPGNLAGLELARWLTLKERGAITEVGGLHKVINAEWPKPVLGAAEKRQLDIERLKAERELAALEAQVSDFQKRLVEPRASLAAVHRSVEANKRWWGLRASKEDRALARIAGKAIPNLRAAITELEAALAVAKDRLKAKREYLLL